LWLAKCLSKVAPDQPSFEAQWFDWTGEAWGLLDKSDMIFRNSVIGLVTEHTWHRKYKECTLPEDLERSFREQLKEHKSLMQRDLIVDLHPPMTPAINTSM
jgi:hypothetical protein